MTHIAFVTACALASLTVSLFKKRHKGQSLLSCGQKDRPLRLVPCVLSYIAAARAFISPASLFTAAISLFIRSAYTAFCAFIAAS